MPRRDEVVVTRTVQDFPEHVVLVSDNGHHREMELPNVSEMYAWLDLHVEGFAQFYQEEGCDEVGRMLLFAVVDLLDPPTDRETKDVDMGLEYHVRNQWASKLWQQSPYSCGLPKVGKNTLVPAESVIAFTYFLAQSNLDCRTDIYHLRGFHPYGIEKTAVSVDSGQLAQYREALLEVQRLNEGFAAQHEVDSGEIARLQEALAQAQQANEELAAQLAAAQGGELYVQLNQAIEAGRYLEDALVIANRRANEAVHDAAVLREQNAELRTQKDRLVISNGQAEQLIKSLRKANADLIGSEAGFSFAVLVVSWTKGLSAPDLEFLSRFLIAQTPQALADELHVPLSNVEGRIGRIFGSYNTFVIKYRTEQENKKIRQLQDDEGSRTKPKKKE